MRQFNGCVRRWSTWLAWLVWAFLMSGCRDDPPRMDQQSAELALSCRVSDMRFPTTAEEFTHLYQNRGFYTDGNHLGRDIDLPEGTPIHPIGCGTIRVYRPASGYGTLAVVIEHEFDPARTAENGLGASVSVKRFLSIYGHLRPSEKHDGGHLLPWKSGDQVGPDDVIGYVQNDADNGDGAEHLHLGIRLQGEVDAEHADPTAWFRGYDTQPSQRVWFADPATFLSQWLMGDCGECPPDMNASPPDLSVLPDLRLAADLSVSPPDLKTGPDLSVPPDLSIVSDLAFQPDLKPLPMPDLAMPPDLVMFPPSVRYEFRVLDGAGWQASEPFRLRDKWWTPVTCANTGSSALQFMGDGWRRCDQVAPLSPFIGSFFSLAHPNWGDQGNLGTVGNSPQHCTPTAGVEWRITNLSNGQLMYAGSSGGLPCVTIGDQDRHQLP